MKLRIKGNTIRLRLTKSEVDYFSQTNYIEEQTQFGKNFFSYRLSVSDSDSVGAEFEDNRISVYVPTQLAKNWTDTNAVGFNGELEIGNNKKLYILVEKDFKCLDETVEDQSDNYENPLGAAYK